MPQATMADKAAVNTCVYNGLMTQMKADGRPWLLTIRYPSHRLKLAIKDSRRKHVEFVQIKDLRITTVYVMKQSDKFKRQFKCPAKVDVRK